MSLPKRERKEELSLVSHSSSRSWSVARWWQNRSGPTNSISYACLKLLSYLYAALQKVHRLFSLHFSRQAPLPIISIGSPRVGGSGKTPLVRHLATKLQEKGFKPVVLSRGYGSSSTGKAKLVDGGSSALSVGDEPWMLSGYALDRSALSTDRIPSTIGVIVAKERYEGALLAKKLGYDIALLDDGMQHYKLKRDIEIAIISRSDLSDQLLPLGKLREPISSISRSDWVLVREMESFSLAEQDYLKSLAPNRVDYALKMDYLEIAPCGMRIEWSDLKGLKAIAFAGIAYPEVFFEQLKKHEIELLEAMPLADHEPVSFENLLNWCDKWAKKGAMAVLCTEKDYARLALTFEQLKALAMPIYWPLWQAKIDDDLFLEQLINKIRSIN